jgi:hypothetical protein
MEVGEDGLADGPRPQHRPSGGHGARGGRTTERARAPDGGRRGGAEAGRNRPEMRSWGRAVVAERRRRAVARASSTAPRLLLARGEKMETGDEVGEVKPVLWLLKARARRWDPSRRHPYAGDVEQRPRGERGLTRSVTLARASARERGRAGFGSRAERMAAAR